MIKAVIFDCFGVLIIDALGVILTKLKLRNPEKADQIIKIINDVIRDQIDVQDSQTKIAAILGISSEEYVHELKSGQVKNYVLLDYIKRLRDDYKIGMLSNVSKDGLDTIFTHEELKLHFDSVIVSGNIGFAKPEARAYEIAAEKLYVRLDECVMIDDRDEYCEGAQHVGMRVIKYVSYSQMKQELEVLLKST